LNCGEVIGEGADPFQPLYFPVLRVRRRVEGLVCTRRDSLAMIAAPYNTIAIIANVFFFSVWAADSGCTAAPTAKSSSIPYSIRWG